MNCTDISKCFVHKRYLPVVECLKSSDGTVTFTRLLTGKNKFTSEPWSYYFDGVTIFKVLLLSGVVSFRTLRYSVRTA